MRRTSALGWLLALGACLSGCGTHRFTVPLMPPLISPPQSPVLWTEPFDVLDLERWHEVEVRRRTDYQVTSLEGRSCLRAQSHDGASILLSSVRFDPETYAWLSWQWRVEELVEGEALERKDGSDAPARVYVYFETKGLPWQKRSLDYVWSSTLPMGTLLNSAYSPTSKIIVVESGDAALGQWRTVERNLKDDYERVFGDDPPDVIAIGVMTDTDNTGGEALAFFDDLQVSRVRPP